MVSKSKHWCVTWNNYPQDWKDKLEKVLGARDKQRLITYWIAGKEVAPQTQTPHLQMFIQLTKRLALTTLKRALAKAGVMPAPHLEAAKGDLEQNQTYCKKEGRWAEKGNPVEFNPKLAGAQSARVDLAALTTAVIEGKENVDLATDAGTAGALARYPKFVETLRQGLKERKSKERAKEKMTGVVLKDWQNKAVLDLDEYVALPPVQLTWCPSKLGSHFREFAYFKTHQYTFC